MAEIVHGPSNQPEGGGKRTKYEVKGLWVNDEFVQPEQLIIELSEGRVTEKPGDILELDRQEAAVVGKRHVIVPIVE